ncbi:MAG: glutathione S-transferase family protein [Alphaproteobacteria bacterium]|nr:glutathione S-transferase family protein [Alphaproteobacteria bacterium]
MSDLTLYYHPLSSFCWKVLIPLYENDTPFTPHLVDLSDAEARAAFTALWPPGQFPVLADKAADRIIPESSIIIEYLDRHHAGAVRFLPADPDLARQTRLRDRFFDLHLHIHMQKVVGDRIRPADKRDPLGVSQAREKIEMALGMVEREMASKTWAMGDSFTMADCAAAPALFYCDKIIPLDGRHPSALAYLERLKARPSFTRVLTEAEPYFANFPG